MCAILDSIGNADGLRFRKIPPEISGRGVQNTMTDRINESMNQSQSDLRANLFYLLQELAGRAETSGHKAAAESPVSGDHIETHQGEDGTVF
jgi:hypothetical protein